MRGGKIRRVDAAEGGYESACYVLWGSRKKKSTETMILAEKDTELTRGLEIVKGSRKGRL